MKNPALRIAQTPVLAGTDARAVKLEAPAKLTKKQKRELYKILLNVTDPEKLDNKSYAQELKVSPQVLGGMIGQLKTNPKMRKELEDAGYTPDQIPEWVCLSVPSNPSITIPPPQGTPRAGLSTKLAQGTSEVGNQVGGADKQVAQVSQGSTTSTP